MASTLEAAVLSFVRKISSAKRGRGKIESLPLKHPSALLMACTEYEKDIWGTPLR
jgi:hypothetical protein